MITLKQLSEELGLSRPTISRALRDSPRVSESTRLLVQRAAARAGYIPNHAASGLRTRRSHTVGIIVPSVADSYWPDIIEGIELRANSAGFSVVIGITRFSPEAVAPIVAGMLRKRVDGIIRISHDTDYDENVLASIGSQVLIDIDFDGVATSTNRIHVASENEAGAYLAMRHLVELGHKRIACIDGPLDRSQIARLRRNGYLNALRESGLEPVHGPSPQTDYSFETGLIAARKLLTAPDPPTAIAACSDQVACAVMKVAYELGIRIPDKLSVIGFGNEGVACQMPVSLTTVEVLALRSGEVAFDRFLEALETEEIVPMRILLPTRVVVRESCAPPDTEEGR